MRTGPSEGERHSLALPAIVVAATSAMIAGCAQVGTIAPPAGPSLDGPAAPALVDPYDREDTGATIVGGGHCSGDDGSIAIDDALERDAADAEVWNLNWGITYAAAAIGQAAVAYGARDRLSDATRASLWLGAGKAGIGALVRAVKPLSIERAEGCADPAAQRRALATAARRERSSMLLNGLGGLALNTAGLLYLGLEHDAWGKGAVSFVAGSVVGVISMYTAPRRSMRLYGRAGGGEPISVAPLVGGEVVGLALGRSW